MRVSVVIPSYNHARYITEAVDSALAAPMDDLEVVLVDDGSNDDTLERLAVYQGDPRVRVHEQGNRGAHAALNRGLELATGDVVFILNSDDSFDPERIPRLVERLERDPDIAVACSWIRIVDDQGATLGIKEGAHNMLPPWSPPRTGPRLGDLGDPRLAMLETNFPSTTSNVAFRRSLVTERGLSFLPLRYTHDWDFVLSACANGRIDVVEETLVSYRVHDANTIREGAEEEQGQGLMRFEILWVIARHAAATLRRFEKDGHSYGELQRRMWASCPTFGHEALLSQLLLVRGDTPVPPAAFDDLLRPAHPLRSAAIVALDAR